MNWTAFRRMSMTEGERGILLAYIGVGLAGAGLSFNIVNQLEGTSAILRPLSTYDIWMILSGAIGACLGLFTQTRWLGNPGLVGLRDMVIAVVRVTCTASIIGGTLALPLYGTMFAPYLLAINLWSHPMMAGFWVATLVGAHGLTWVWRRERDTIFAPPVDDGIPV